MTKPQLPNLQQTVANTILITNISKSNNLNKFWVGIITRQGHINQVYQTGVSQWVSEWVSESVSDRHCHWLDSGLIINVLFHIISTFDPNGSLSINCNLKESRWSSETPQTATPLAWISDLVWNIFRKSVEAVSSHINVWNLLRK